MNVRMFIECCEGVLEHRRVTQLGELFGPALAGALTTAACKQDRNHRWNSHDVTCWDFHTRKPSSVVPIRQ